MDKYQLMRLAESMDDDGPDDDEFAPPESETDTEKFKRKYKEFYTDIKISIKEDW